jgi:molybdopterin-guanine dinucleotide biosynthesis protein A
MNDTAIAILAGGQSRRMGRDKALLEIDGQSLLQHTVEKARQVAVEVMVVGRPCPDNWPAEFNAIRCIPDERPGEGPLGGLFSALHALPHTYEKVLLMACDMPLLSAEALRWLVRQGENNPGAHGVIVSHNTHWEPLFAIYRREVLPLVESQLAMERRALHALIGAGDFHIVEAPTWLQPQLANANTPQDWQSLIPPEGSAKAAN